MYFFMSIKFSVSTARVWNIPEIPPNESAGSKNNSKVFNGMSALQILTQPPAISINGVT